MYQYGINKCKNVSIKTNREVTDMTIGSISMPIFLFIVVCFTIGHCTVDTEEGKANAFIASLIYVIYAISILSYLVHDMHVKAQMNQIIHIIPQLKQGIGKLYATIDFINGFIEMRGTRSKQELQNEKFLFKSCVRTRYLPLTRQTCYPLHHEADLIVNNYR